MAGHVRGWVPGMSGPITSSFLDAYFPAHPEVVRGRKIENAVGLAGGVFDFCFRVPGEMET